MELKNAEFDIHKINVPKRVYLLADSLYDAMLLRNCGTYKYPLGGELFVFDENENIGFIKGHMCSPAIATQAEDLIAGGVKELIHVGFAGGLQTDMRAAIYIISDVFAPHYWKLGWGENTLEDSIDKVIDMMISAAAEQ